MARKVSIGFNWQGPMDYDQALARVRLADEAGVDTAWVAEAWGRDCFTMLALMARETQRIHLGTGIVTTQAPKELRSTGQSDYDPAYELSNSYRS
jgi:alkanesulfonate monooxygenase SsuD/methylene tetrahydromethanopterin reductase-like flavin-dependent oxidoreductase (luciferase family)